MSKEEKQKFFAYTIPCDRAFVVAPEKAEEFINLKPNPELKKKIDEATSKLNIKIELEQGTPLKKVLRYKKN